MANEKCAKNDCEKRSGARAGNLEARGERDGQAKRLDWGKGKG